MNVASLLFGATVFNLTCLVALWLESGQACYRMGHKRSQNGICARCGDYRPTPRPRGHIPR